MKSNIYSVTLPSKHYYMDEEPTQVSYTSRPSSPSSSSNHFHASPLRSSVLSRVHIEQYGSVASQGLASMTVKDAGPANKKGMFSKLFNRRKNTHPNDTMSKVPCPHVTSNMSSKAQGRLQASEQFGPHDRSSTFGRTTPTCSDLSGESGLLDAPNVEFPKATTSTSTNFHEPKSPRKEKTKVRTPVEVPIRRDISDLIERIPDLPPLHEPIWIKPTIQREERIQISPKHRASRFYNDELSLIESPRPSFAKMPPGLKPPPLTFQESDKKMPALKSPPLSQKSLPDDPAELPELQPDDLMFEIEPGHSLLLRGRKPETKEYIQGGKDIATQECVCCEGMIHCVGDASFLLCPFCRVVQPLLLTSSEREAYGLALGFSSQEWIEMSSEDAWSAV